MVATDAAMAKPATGLRNDDLVVVDAFISSSCSPSTHSQQHRRSTELFVLQEKLSSEEIQARLKSQLEKLREKDRASGPYSAKVSSIVLIMSTGGPRC